MDKEENTEPEEDTVDRRGRHRTRGRYSGQMRKTQQHRRKMAAEKEDTTIDDRDAAMVGKDKATDDKERTTKDKATEPQKEGTATEEEDNKRENCQKSKTEEKMTKIQLHIVGKLSIPSTAVVAWSPAFPR